LLIGLILITGAVFSYLAPNFMTQASLINVARQATVMWIVALGTTFVLTSGEIDLSVGSVVALVSMVGATMIREGYPLPLVMVGSLGTGLAVGAVNAFLTLQLRVPSFLATLGTLAVLRGLAWEVSLQYVPVRSIWFIKFFRMSPLGVPMPIFIALALTVVAGLLLHFSRFGVRTRAVGSSEDAAQLAGLKVNQNKFLVFMLASAMAAIGGIVYMGRTNYGMPTAATGLELQVIAAVILGGTRLGGGVGSVIGTTLGALLITVIFVGIATLGLPGPYQDVARGTAIVLAILLMRR
jgi:ribose transport system permease protein